MKIRPLILWLLMVLPMTAISDGRTLLREGHPESYQVKEGDTLWGIASMFLIDPWHWPEIWQANSDIDNPHLIYPGDQIVLQYDGTEPQLAVKRGAASRSYKMKPEQRVRHGERYEKLEPRVRIEPLSAAISAIPLDAVASLMSTGRIVEEEVLEVAPRIISGKSERLIFGPGDEFYARGDWREETSVYGIFRPGNVYVDPESEEILGFEAIEVGLARAIDRDGDVLTFSMASVQEDVRIGDRLMPTEERRVESTFYPRPPETEVRGVIMNVLGGVTQVGRNDVVVVNRGTNDGLDVGNVLAIAKKGAVVRDRFDRKLVQLPTERSGVLMIFRAFEKMAYGLVLQTTEPLRVGDVVRTP